MVFSSQLFLFYFLPVSLAVYYLLPASSMRWRNLWLAVTGYCFYGWAEPRFVGLMFATTSLDWMLSLVIARGRWLFWRAEGTIRKVGDPPGPNSRVSVKTERYALLASVISNLAALGFFKYFNFGVDSWNRLAGAAGWDAAVWGGAFQVVLPLGISFYTFQALSYTIDVYRGEAEAMENFIDFSCFVSMFPHLVAGPILKFSFLAEQLRERTVTLEKVARGTAFFLMGLGKKVLLANPCGKIADLSFDSAVRGIGEAWLGAVAYALQIYFDFSGYSDMAIGLGLLFGFYFARNFNAPYRSCSLTEFWRRWHISLSVWLREYLYIPLGGNRCGTWRTYRNLLLTMLLGGLWHGASWNFLFWGGLHGGVLALERFASTRGQLRLPAGLGWIMTTLIVLIGWVFFRAADLSSAIDYLGSMVCGGRSLAGSFVAIGQPYLLVSFVMALLVAAVGIQTWDWTQNLNGWKVVTVGLIGMAALVMLITQDYNPFIYFIF